MAIDFTTGLIAASMGRSKHSKTGRLSSKAGWVGLAKKFCILLMVVVAVRMDIMIGTTYIRDATCIGFCVNELLSIIENTSLMGIPYPPAIKKAIEVLQKRAAHIDDDIQEMIDEGKMGFRAETKDGKKTGFMSYTEDEIAEINGGLNEYLIKMLYGK